MVIKLLFKYFYNITEKQYKIKTVGMGTSTCYETKLD